MKKKNQNQRGNVLMLIIPVVAGLLLVAMLGVFLLMSHDKKPAKPATSTVTADDALTNGNANADLTQDVRILDAGVTRDKSYVSSTNTALSDESQPVLND